MGLDQVTQVGIGHHAMLSVTMPSNRTFSIKPTYLPTIPEQWTGCVYLLVCKPTNHRIRTTPFQAQQV